MKFPVEFMARLRTQEYIDPERLLNSMQEPSPTSIRINADKWNKAPSGAEKVQWCETGYYLPDRPSYTFDPLFHSGCYYPQDASGMFLEQIFTQLVGRGSDLKVLDLCGAPGGKSTHLSTLIGRENLLVANEVIGSRASILSENITRWGLSNTIVTRSDPSAFGKINDYFDVILVDAPCSGEGMFRDPVAVREWSESAASHCADRQRRILASVWPALKPGGLLIYSTCTFNPGENEDMVKWLTDNHDAKPVDLDITPFDGITAVRLGLITGYGFYPGKIRGDGLFFSVVRKEGNQYKKHHKTVGGTRNEIARGDYKIVQEWTSFPVDRIYRTGEEIFYLPADINDYLLLGRFLKIVNPGTKICTVKKDAYVPAHDLALSTTLLEGAFYTVDADYDEAIRFLKKSPLQTVTPGKGIFLLKYNGVNLGFCNNIGSRINNYYPVEWRIRINQTGDESGKIIKWNE